MIGVVPTKVPYPVRLRELVVLRREWLSPALVRIVLGGPGLAGFQSHLAEEHVRLVLPEPDGTLRLPEQQGDALLWPRPLPTSREYTVRRHDVATGELDVDFVVHAGGLASDWATSVAVGESVHVAGPPGGRVIPLDCDHYLFAGDLSAQPQIARHLETLPATSRGWVFLDVADAGEEFPMFAPEGFAVRWVHRGSAPAGTAPEFQAAVQAVAIPEQGRTFVWIAGEAGVLKPLRRWLRHDLGHPRGDHLVTGYWKRGVADFDED